MFIKKLSIFLLILLVMLSSFDFTSFIFGINNSYNKIFNPVVDKIYLAKNNKNVVDKFFRIEKTYSAVNSNEKEYIIDIGPVVGSTTANYVYASFFNPSGSGKTTSIKRIAIRSNTASSTASNYVNLTLRRITTASGGTQISATNFPKKNASSTDSIMETRYGGVTATFSGVTDSRIIGLPLSGGVGVRHSKRDIVFNQNDEKFVLQEGEGIALYQEAAGTLATSVRIIIEWDENTNTPQSEDGFLFSFPRVEVAATNNYVYNSFFNPSASGKTAIIRRIWFGAETCDTTALYTNNIVLKRISSASGGTAISASNIPKKNTSGVNSVMDFRRTNVTVTQVGGADARIGHITPCGAAGQAHSWQEINFSDNDEKFVLQEGEGIALISEGTGDLDHLVRMIIEWDEESSVPSSSGEYFWSSGKVASSTAINATMYSFFNPSGSGKVAIIKRLGIRVNATTTATYASYQWRRLSSATGGTLITASDLPKKHTGTANSAMEMRWCLQACNSIISAIYQDTTSSKLLSVTSPGAVAQTIGQKEIVFDDNEKIVLKEGEGIGFYNDVLVGSQASSVKVFIEWDEENTAPSSQGEYLMDIGPINGSTATNYNYISFFNPVSSGKYAVIKRVAIRVNAVAPAVYVPIQLRRTTSSSGGTLVASSSYPKKHQDTATSSMEIRTTGVTVTYSGATTSRLLAIQTPGAVGSVTSGDTGHNEIIFKNNENLILKPGEGIVLYQNPTAGDADLRVRLLIEWGEESVVPSPLNEFLMTIGPINQSTAANYVYATIFNPINSAKNYIIKKLGSRIDRSGTATNPAYTKVSIRKISSSSSGTLVATTSINKNTNSATTTAEIRSTNPTVSFLGVTDSRILGVTTPGVVNQIFGDYDSNIFFGDELILKPGEGLALYQEEATGDANVRHHFSLEWKEESNAPPAQSITFTISTSTIYFGTVTSALPRYASSTNQSGSDSEVIAHTVSVITNADNGYALTVKGQTLTSGSSTILAIGNTSTSSQPGTEQFGIRLTASGGSGVVLSPYNGSGFAYGSTATTSSQIASASVGDNATTTYSIRYIANISPTTISSVYNASIVFIATANF